MTTAPVPPRQAARQVCRVLRGAGHQALLAGGCVRDLLLGRTPGDYDVATDARPDQVRKLFRRIVEVGAAFGVMRVQIDGREFEVATFRSDLAYVDGRRPTGVEFTDARTDAERRDFTINGMFLDPETDEVLDYVGGRADLDARVLRAIRNPEERFAEDRLRMLRAVRFATVLGFAIDPDTEAAVRLHAREITVVSGERIRVELMKTLSHPHRLTGVRLLWELGLLGAILPETADEYPPSPALPAGLRAAVEVLPADARWEVALAVLLKGGPRMVDSLLSAPDGGALYQRALSWALKIRDVAERLALMRTERALIESLVRSQWALDFASELDLAGKKRLFARPEFEELILLHAARAAEFPLPRPDAEEALRLHRSLSREEIEPPPLINGRDLLGLGAAPGPAVGRTLEAVYDAQLRGELRDRDAALAAAREMLARRP